MSTVAERQFFNAQGAESICSAFARELATKGTLGERGHPPIDEFVAAVNAKLSLTMSDEAKEVLIGMVAYCINNCIGMGMDEGLNEDGSPQPFRAELEEFIK